MIKAFAKVNLSLDVVGKREDGYHLLKMIMQNIELYDLVEVKRTNKGINLRCDKSYVPNDIRNTAYKAAKLFLITYNIDSGVDIYIKKNIPIAAGLAGGSADAAAVLKAMREIFRPDILDKELMELGLQIGADVPYCIMGGTVLCEGIGEVITPLKSFNNKILVVIKPAFGVSTKEVYSKLDIGKIYRHPDTDLLIKAIDSNDLRLLSKNMRNVLENVTLKKHNILIDIKRQTLNLGAVGSLMSGSGPTIFAFFDDIYKAQICYDKMKEKYREVFLTRTI